MVQKYGKMSINSFIFKTAQTDYIFSDVKEKETERKEERD